MYIQTINTHLTFTAMYIKTLLVIGAIILCNNSFAQDNNRYFELIEEAEHLYEMDEYLKSGHKYAEAFLISENEIFSIVDRYYAARSWALANETDSAFLQLFYFSNHLYDTENFYHFSVNYFLQIPEILLEDTVMNSLHGDKRWHEFLDMLKDNRNKAKAGLDMELVTILDAIYKIDQAIRDPIDSIAQAYGWESEELKEYEKFMHKQDSINLITVESILAEHGWLGADVVGHEGNLTLWLVIQHSDIDTQEKYLPMMRDAFEKGNARADDLAYLEDRVAVRQGRKQLYGTQLAEDSLPGEWVVSPLIDPDNVDKRRAEIGLESIQEYVSQWGLTWDLEEHKKRIIEMDAKQKK